MPLPCAGEGEAAGVIGALEAAVLEKARQAVASRLSFPVPGQRHISLSRLAVEAPPLEGILQEAEIAQLADEVLTWLREEGALLDGSDGAEVVRRLAEAGRSGRSIDSPLTDEQVRALGDAFERMAPKDRAALGSDVGRAVRLQSYTYDTEGHKKTGAARPVDAYLPRAIDRERDSFAVAAGKSQGLVWLSDRYAKTLRSQAGREGIGALRFLRLLGAETAPRLQPHPQLEQRYTRESQLGLPEWIADGSEARSSAMSGRGATYTLEDHDSPDLLAVITDISRERQGKRRRDRAGALLSALGRAWDRRLSEFAEVDAASDYYGWEFRGRIRAFWLTQAGDVAWLDDERGTARKPAELCVRTPGTEAIYGASSPDYLHACLSLCGSRRSGPAKPE